MLARSPVVPSSLRYSTLYMNSIWAVALDCQLGALASELPAITRQLVGGEILKRSLRGYSTVGAFSIVETERSCFAFEETSGIPSLFDNTAFVDETDRGYFQVLAEFHSNLATSSGLREHLRHLVTLHPKEQSITFLFLRQAALTCPDLTDTVAGWIAETSGLIELLLNVDQDVLVELLDALIEYQFRLQAEWAVRMPHLLVHAIEQLDSRERVDVLFNYVLHMSLNVGICSPIERAWNSKWRGDFNEPLSTWRMNLLNLAQHSTPWVAGRIRSMLSGISALIGARSFENEDYSAFELDHADSSNGGNS